VNITVSFSLSFTVAKSSQSCLCIFVQRFPTLFSRINCTLYFFSTWVVPQLCRNISGKSYRSHHINCPKGGKLKEFSMTHFLSCFSLMAFPNWPNSIGLLRGSVGAFINTGQSPPISATRFLDFRLDFDKIIELAAL
jgi:hypothetical protein